MLVFRIVRLLQKKDLSVRKSLSKETKSRRAFIRSHKFSVNINPSTDEAQIKITKE